jgi:5-methylcytosine-specific restriction endonuclease McrA
MEKTRITHLDDGFDFLGFTVRRGMGHDGMKTKVLISKKGRGKHLNTIQAATSPNSHEDSITAKFKALNRIIAGWCRYYQYTSKAATQFSKLERQTFWHMAHWLGRKFQLPMPIVIRRFCKESSLTDGKTTLTRHTNYPTQQYQKRFLKPNPYTTQERIEREELPDENPWPGFEDRPGWTDLRQRAGERDNWTCGICKRVGTPATCQVDHIIQYSRYKRPVDANRLENLWTLCIPCHKRKTEAEQRMESRMQ